MAKKTWLCIAAGVIVAVLSFAFAYQLAKPERLQQVLFVLTIGFWFGWGVVRLVARAVEKFESEKR